VVGTLTVLFLGAGMAPAQAHDALVSSSPRPGAVLPTAPSAVELDFTGTPLPLGTQVLVVGPDGEQVSVGAAEIRDTAVVQALSEPLPAGTFTVEWRSTSSDGHALTGALDFTVTAGSTPAAAGPVAAGPQTTTRQTTTPETTTAEATTASAAEPTDAGLPVGRLVAAVVGLGALGTLLAVRLRRRA